LKEDEALDPETTVVKGNPPADERFPDSIPPESVAVREIQDSDLKPPAPASLVVSIPSSGSVETSDTKDISVPSPPLTRGRKTNKAQREKEVASNISLGCHKQLDPFFKGKISTS
jgi:hypothetical protein